METLSENGTAVGDSQSSAGQTAPAPGGYSVVNPKYYSSWFQVAFSRDLGRNEVVPLHVLERKLVLWRDSRGELHCSDAYCRHLGAHLACGGYGGEVVDNCLRCPFHGWLYDENGAVAHVPGVEGRPRVKARLPIFRVIERYGSIFLWNGEDPPDHDFPDILAEEGLSESDVMFSHCRFWYPFPAKMIAENSCDAGHFAALHGVGQWGNSEVIEETSTRLSYITRFYGDRTPGIDWAAVKKAFRRGELWNLVDITGGDIRFTVYGGSLQLLKMVPASEEIQQQRRNAKGLFPKVASRATEALSGFLDPAPFLMAFTPVTADTHVFYFTFFAPNIKVRWVGGLLQRLLNEALYRRNWLAVEQDTSLMVNREEPINPAYTQFDRALVRYRRFCDRRILDRSLWPGDAIHSNGARAGITWPEAGESGRLTDLEVDAPPVRVSQSPTGDA